MPLAKIVYASMTGNTEEIAAVVAEKLESLGLVVDLEDLDLTGKVFGVIGSGDTFYDEFCKSVDDFEAAFTKTSATKGADSVKVDLAAEDADITKLEAFAEALAAKVN